MFFKKRRLKKSNTGNNQPSKIFKQISSKHKSNKKPHEKIESIVSSIIDNTLVGVFQSSSSGKVFYMNRPLLKMLEYDSVEDINRLGGAGILYKYPGKRDKIINLLKKKHYLGDLEVEFVSKTGKQIYTYLCMRIEGDILSGTIVDITKLKTSEDQLKKTKSYSEMLLMASPAAIYTVDLKQRITRWNNRAKEITGYRPEEVIGKKCTLFMSSPCRDKCGLYSPDVKKPVIGKECTLIRQDGQLRIVLKNTDFLLDEDGNIIGGIESIEDITERKQLEKALEKSEESFRNTFEQTAVGISHVGLDGRWIFINQGYCDLVGYTHDELLKKTFKEITHPEDIKIDYENFQMMINKKIDHYQREKRYVRKDGSTVWVDLTVSAIKDKSGNVEYLIAVAIDINERKKAEEQLNILSGFPRVNPNPVLRINEKGEILYKNPATTKLLKKVRLSEKDTLDILPQNIIISINKSLRNKTTVSDLESVIGNKIYSFTLAPIPEQKYVNLYGSDITERKKIEIMRESAFREVSHELKTPIAMIEMAQNINLQGIKNNDMSRIIKTQDIITNNLRRLSKDVNNILDMFVLKRKRVLNKMQLSLKEMIEDIAKNVQYLLYEKKLKFKMDIPKNIDNIYADPQEIKILLNNIIDNAIKFTDKGYISVSVRSRGKFIRIAVKDSGSGISPEIKDNIFTRFFKRHPAVPGTGLGLTISKEIIEMHNGKIEVFSKGEGKGTIVAVYLPLLI